MNRSPKITTHKGKGSRSELLPHRSALTQLTKGDTTQRSLGNYAKLTPGIGDNGSPSITGFGGGVGDGGTEI